MKECVGTTYAPAAMDVALKVTHSVLAGTVVIGVTRDAEINRTLDKCFAERVGPVRIGDGQGTTAPAKAVIAWPDTDLGAHEIRQNFVVAPALIAARGPVVEVVSLAPAVDQPIDRTGASDNAPLRNLEDPCCCGFARLAAKLPQERWLIEHFHKTSRNPNIDALIRNASFEYTDAHAFVLCQTIG